MSVSDLTIFPVRSFRDQLRFIKLPREIQKNDPQFVPPLVPEMLKTLNQKKNPFFQNAKMEMFLAKQNGNLVGRIAAIRNEIHDQTHNEHCGFFGYFESINDKSVANELLKTAQRWTQERGANIFRGPINLSTNNEIGLLVDGFDTPPAVMTTHNPPYYEKLLQDFGLQSVKELLGYDVKSKGIAIDRLRRVSERVRERGRFTTRKLSMKNFQTEIETMRKIYNAAWEKNWGFVPVSAAEFQFSAKGLKQIVDPELALFAEADSKPIAFIAAIPDINWAVKQIDGKLLPFGIFRLPGLLKKTHAVRMPLFGVHPSHRNSGIEGVLLLELIERGIARGVERCDCSWILEDNLLIRRPIEAIGGRIYKRYRIYEKTIP